MIERWFEQNTPIQLGVFKGTGDELKEMLDKGANLIVKDGEIIIMSDREEKGVLF